MNKAFTNNDQFISNKRIMEAYFAEAEMTAGKLDGILDRIAAILLSILSVLTCARVISLTRTCVAVGCLVGFVGLIGAMESGSISLLSGLLLSVPVLGVEYLTLKGYCKKRRKN